MSYSVKHKIYFVHIPKNGGTTIETNLNLNSPGHDHWEICKRKHQKEWSEFYKFAVIRDPIDRFVSNYKYSRMEKSYYHSITGNSKYGKHPDFDLCSSHGIDEVVDALYNETYQFRHPGWKHQAPYIFDENDTLQVDEVLTMSDINSFISRYVQKTPEIKNVSEQISESMSDKSKNMLREYYERDFRLLTQYLEKK